jgi:nickel transport protein
MRNYKYLFLFILLLSESAYAHKVKLFATVTGDVISGYVYFPGGERAQAVSVKIFLANNQLEDTVQTNERGEFQFHAKTHATHRLVANLGEGHLAEYTVNANEFSDIAPIADREPSVENLAVSPQNCNISEQLPEIVAKVVSQQIRPLREQLEAYQEKIGLHDILGGIGYIFGVMGVLFYLAKRPEK